MTIRRETEPPKRHQFTTVKGERDGSDVVFPGVYTYEAGRGRHGSGDGGRLWQCSGDGCYASVCSVLLTVGAKHFYVQSITVWWCRVVFRSAW